MLAARSMCRWSSVRVGLARRAAEQVVKPPVRHRQPLAVVEIPHVEPKTAIGLQVDQVLEDRVLVDRLPIRRQTHQLVLAAVDREAAVIRERRVQQPDRMRKLQMVRELDLVARAAAVRRRAPLADAVQSQNRRLVERAGKERAGRVAFVVIQKDQVRPLRAVQSLADRLGACAACL